jgi:hypothetical protein
MGDKNGCWFKCFFKIVFALILLCEFIVLPTVGLVWWFITKSPAQFMLTCIGMFLLWCGTGILYFLLAVGLGKYRQLSGKAHKYDHA